MNTKIIIWTVGILLGAVIVAALWYVLSASRSEPKISQSPVTLPIGGTVNPATVSSTTLSGMEQKTMALMAQDGGAVVARDFIHNDVTIPDAANVGRYLLAGNLGYCLSESQLCQAASTSDFNVYYNSDQQSFTIALTREPIGQARLAMEQFMLTTLGITQQQLCSLNYLVGVSTHVSPNYTGKNLGFSFCPGATVLPK